jgi:hypothetical protein
MAAANAGRVEGASVDAIPSSDIAFKPVEAEPLKSVEKRVAVVLAGMPAGPAVYRDIGNMYFNAVNLQRAWLVCRSAEPNLWAHVDAIEAAARRRHPEFF